MQQTVKYSGVKVIVGGCTNECRVGQPVNYVCHYKCGKGSGRIARPIKKTKKEEKQKKRVCEH